MIIGLQDTVLSRVILYFRVTLCVSPPPSILHTHDLLLLRLGVATGTSEQVLALLVTPFRALRLRSQAHGAHSRPSTSFICDIRIASD